MTIKKQIVYVTSDGWEFEKEEDANEHEEELELKKQFDKIKTKTNRQYKTLPLIWYYLENAEEAKILCSKYDSGSRAPLMPLKQWVTIATWMEPVTLEELKNNVEQLENFLLED